MNNFFSAIFMACALLIGCESCKNHDITSPPVVPTSSNTVTIPSSQADPDPGTIPPTIIWEEGPEHAMTVAQVTGRPLLLYFYAVWCPYCRMTDESVWSDLRIIKLLRDEDYVCVRIDLDVREDLAERYGAFGIPQILLVDVDQAGSQVVLERIRGYYKNIEIYLNVLDI